MKLQSHSKTTLATISAIILCIATSRRFAWLASYLRVGVNTTFDIILYAATLRRCIWLEGRVSGGVFRNWIRHFSYVPGEFRRPTTEEEIVELVRESKSLRVFGAGHSFNAGILSDQTLVSLDECCQVHAHNSLMRP
jgi:hypothetical protein